MSGRGLASVTNCTALQWREEREETLKLYTNFITIIINVCFICFLDIGSGFGRKRV